MGAALQINNHTASWGWPTVSLLFALFENDSERSDLYCLLVEIFEIFLLKSRILLTFFINLIEMQEKLDNLVFIVFVLVSEQRGCEFLHFFLNNNWIFMMLNQIGYIMCNRFHYVHGDET